MKIVNIQFFAIPKEIIAFLQNAKSVYGLELYFLIEEGNIFEAKYLDDENAEKLKKGNYTLILSRVMIDIGKLLQSKFEELNKNALYLSLGNYNKVELKESWMFTLKIADDEETNIIWNKIGKDLKKQTQTGGYSVFEPTDEKKFSKSLRYTKKAEEVYKAGVKILPAFGKNIHFEIEK